MKTPKDPEAAETVQTKETPAVVQERLVRVRLFEAVISGLKFEQVAAATGKPVGELALGAKQQLAEFVRRLPNVIASHGKGWTITRSDQGFGAWRVEMHYSIASSSGVLFESELPYDSDTKSTDQTAMNHRNAAKSGASSASCSPFAEWCAGMGALVSRHDKRLLRCAWNAAILKAWDEAGVGTRVGDKIKGLICEPNAIGDGRRDETPPRQ